MAKWDADPRDYCEGKPYPFGKIVARDGDEEFVIEAVRSLAKLARFLQMRMTEERWSQREVAAMVGVSQAAVSRLLNGKGWPPTHVSLGLFHAVGGRLQVGRDAPPSR